MFSLNELNTAVQSFINSEHYVVNKSVYEKTPENCLKDFLQFLTFTTQATKVSVVTADLEPATTPALSPNSVPHDLQPTLAYPLGDFKDNTATMAVDAAVPVFSSQKDVEARPNGTIDYTKTSQNIDAKVTNRVVDMRKETVDPFSLYR